MPTEVIMPQLGESVVEGTVTKWLKSTGDPVEEFEPLLEVNTDKVDSEIPSPASGTLLEILVPEGTTIQAGTVLARIGEPGETTTNGSETSDAPAAATQPVVETTPTAADQAVPESVPAAGRDRELGFISPVVARIAQEHKIDLYQVVGTGQGGRITKNDVLTYIEQIGERKQAEEVAADGASEKTVRRSAPQPPAIPREAAPSAPLPSAQGQVAGEMLPLTSVRRAIAEHMVYSKRTSPHVTTVMEADLSRVIAHRDANKVAFSRDGANLTFTAYFLAATVIALKAYPLVNSSWTEEGILLHRDVHIGVAASLGEAGLIVPVIKNADGLSLLGLARSVNDLSNRARARQLKPEEVKGGTFTITNHGVTGSLFAYPIINQPQCGILGIGVIQKRVMVVNDSNGSDSIAIRPMVYLSLTFDHRILDGAVADNFLGKVVESLQNWS